MIDLPTLALATGLGNLVFAGLAKVYEISAHAPNPALTIWRRARMVGGIALLINSLRLSLSMVALSQALLLLAFSLELSAYARLRGQVSWHRTLTVLTVIAITGRIALFALNLPRSVDLVYFSLCNGLFFAAMGALLLTRRKAGPLTLILGATNSLGALIFFIRSAWGIWFQALVPFQPVIINVVMWVAGFMIVIANGFGFLLLAKQRDDEQIRQALADVVLAESEQRQLLSLASHEFRTPAAMIKASLDSLKYLSDDPPPEIAKRLVNINKATQRMTHLADALIAQDRLRELRFGLTPRPIDLEALIREITNNYAVPLAWQGLGRPLTIEADPDLLTIALYNLIDNALRHSTSDNPPRVSLTQSDSRLEIAVADHGPGVPDAEKKALFERFYRRDSGPGSGLGLSIVQKIAQLHGGHVEIRDNQPRGASFVICMKSIHVEKPLTTPGR